MCVRTHKHARTYARTHTHRGHGRSGPSERAQRAQGPTGRPRHRGSPCARRRQSEAPEVTAENRARRGHHGAGRPGGQETTRTATKELVVTTAQGTQPMPNEGGPYHYFWVLRDVLVARRIQDHAAGVRVQAVDVEHAVLDVPPGPLQDLPGRAETKGRAAVT